MNLRRIGQAAGRHESLKALWQDVTNRRDVIEKTIVYGNGAGGIGAEESDIWRTVAVAYRDLAIVLSRANDWYKAGEQPSAVTIDGKKATPHIVWSAVAADDLDPPKVSDEQFREQLAEPLEREARRKAAHIVAIVESTIRYLSLPSDQALRLKSAMAKAMRATGGEST